MNTKVVHRWRAAICIFVCLCGVISGAFRAEAQSNTGSIHGVVTDQRGQVVAGAAIAILTPTAVSRTAISAADGKWSVSEIPAGTYTVKTSATGFGTDVHPNVIIPAGESANLPVALTMASVSEEVTVEAEADTSMAAQAAPVKAMLDEASARTEITNKYIRDFTSPVTDLPTSCRLLRAPSA